jgi:ABC-type phosphate transport system substrate-binding protein
MPGLIPKGTSEGLMGRRSIVCAGLVFAVVGATARESRGQECVFSANKVIIAGSTAMDPLVKNAAGPLATVGDIDVYYAPVGSCTGSTGFAMKTLNLGGMMATHYDAQGVNTPCTFPAGTTADVGASDVFYPSCKAGDLPAGYADIQGPVQAMAFVVPFMSSQVALVAEEGYFVFGFGTAGYNGMTIPPWTDQTKFAIRNPGSGTQQMTARAVGLPDGSVMKGMDANGTKGVIMTLTAANASASTAESAIGILGAADYDQGTGRMVMKELAFQSFHQIHAYYPDSTPTSFDKRNVRDGKYGVWGPFHFVAAVGADGKVTNPRVQNLINYVNLVTPLGTFSMLDVTINAHLVPLCAMKVKRTAEIGDMSPYTPDPGTACGCYMDEKLSPGSSGCTACTTDAPCGTKKCSHGFCE